MTEDQFDSWAYQQKMQDLEREYALKQARKDFKKLSQLVGHDLRIHEQLIEEACQDETYSQEMHRLIKDRDAKQRAILARKAEQKAKEDFSRNKQSIEEARRQRAKDLRPKQPVTEYVVILAICAVWLLFVFAVAGVTVIAPRSSVARWPVS